MASAHSTAERVARESYGRLVAYLARRTRDLAGAEDALADAFTQALATWPSRGIPDRPDAWLLAVARNRQRDRARREATHDDNAEHLLAVANDSAASDETPVPDHRLALMFACAHPAIDPAIQAPLMLQVILGFDAERIAGVFLTNPATMGQRLVRAKRRIKDAGISVALPDPEVLPARLGAVLDAIYAVFSEGWTEEIGAESGRRELTSEALWLGRMCHHLAPDEPEVAGLLALMLFADSRRAARRAPDGAFVPLSAQATDAWDPNQIAEAESLLAVAVTHRRFGRYQLEAAIQSAHASRRHTGVTPWLDIVALYDALITQQPTSVTLINRAIAIGAAHGPERGLAELPALASDPRLLAYQPYWAARAHLRAATHHPDASADFERAAALATDPAARAYLLARRPLTPTAAASRTSRC